MISWNCNFSKLKIIIAFRLQLYMTEKGEENMETFILDISGNSYQAIIKIGEKIKSNKSEELARLVGVKEKIIINEENNSTYFIENIEKEYVLVSSIDSEEAEKYIVSSQSYKNLKEELDSIMNLSGELVTIVNNQGIVERVSSNCKKIMGIEVDDFVGKSIFELEKSGVVTLSSTKKVLETLREVTMTQKTKGNRRLYVQGFPIFNENGSLEKILNISKDVTEESNLRERLKETEREVELLMEEINKESENINKIIKSKKIQEIYYLLNKVAKTDATVLFLGETGVGKGVFAQHLHDTSSRSNSPFINVNCSVLPEHLMESELFGYAKGSFTGANLHGKKGLIEAADNGTLFLDEIGELPLQTQAKLLQVLQDKSFTPIGKTTPIKVNVRFVAATNKDLIKMMEKGEFRSDLYYRLNVVPIQIPPLRERQEDIPFLLHHFLDIFNAKYQRSCSLSLEVLDQLSYFNWPGNVRELQNTIERLIITSSKNLIDVEDLPGSMVNKQRFGNLDNLENKSLREIINQYEKEILINTYEKSRNLSEMSTFLKMDISTISRKFKKHNIDLR
jgi:transcriptional regulator with PAS, ATPase and Fis domain